MTNSSASQSDDACLQILVVEDHLDAQQLACEVLAALGHHALGVVSGEEALVALRQTPYDVLFTDISLPGISGIELARLSRVLNPSLNIIFASGYGAQISANFGSDAYSLPKPYDMDQLLGILTCIRRKLRTSPGKPPT